MPSKSSAFPTVALLIVIAMLAWLIYRVETALRAPQAVATPSQTADPRIPPPLQGGPQIAPPPLAGPIEGGEAGVAGRPPPPPPQTGPKIDPDSPEAQAADRKLAELLPQREVNQRILADYQAKLEKLPAKEQAQVSAALSRAIEQGRVVYRADH